jgi:S-adenosylmethionine synthetase
MARYIAKNVVAAGLADRCEVQLSYAIGVAEPTSVLVDCFGTAKADEDKISKAVREVFALTPRKIIEGLGLRNPIYAATARHGHFGRKPYESQYFDRVKKENRGGKLQFFTWEKTDKADALKSLVK